MQANSRPVISNQAHIHPNLVPVVQRHLSTDHQAVTRPHNILAYETLASALAAQHSPLVLDSFCGTGQSTAALARRHPQHFVVGIDKSAQRLAKHSTAPADPDQQSGSEQPNYLLLQADCEEIWKLLAQNNHHIDFHYLLYPNPWPKSSHLQRRIHGHPAFPLLLHLGGQLELRSNWQTYVEEFGVAMHVAGYRGKISRLAADTTALTLFEEKYRNSGHSLWSYATTITKPGTATIMP